MKNFIPRFDVATLQPPQTRLIPKLGGLPWGFLADKWPYCRECSMPMALLAQLPHHAPVLDFGDSRWVLHLFQCTTAGCSTWSSDEGCNAAFMLPREAIGEGLTRAPQVATERPTYARICGSEPVVNSMHGELWLTGWQEHEDAVPEDLRPAYSDYDAFCAVPEELQFPHKFDGRFRTKAGGVPYWTVNGPGYLTAQGPVSTIPRPFDYLMQIDTDFCMPGRLPDPSAIGCNVYVDRPNRQVEVRPVPSAAKRDNAPWYAGQELDRDDEYWVQFANFGSDGTAYVFIDRAPNPPRILYFWNR